MADIKVRDLTDTSSVALDNQIMVLTNDAQNQVQNITVENLLTNVLSSDNGNVLEQGTDGKLYVETPENITGNLADLDTVNKTSLVNSINEGVSNLSNEATTRANADNNLQSQIDAITAASDVTDIVGTYAQLQAYDTTGLPNKSIIKVLQDESRQNETTYYRWVITGGVGAWVLIGEEGPYYTKSQADSLFATQQTTGNLASLDTSDKTSLVNAINELSSVLDPTQTADYINNSKAVESGAISSNSIILSNVIKYAHSTFDPSKFTVVGNPVITNDGIASGFSSGNRIKKDVVYSFIKGFEIDFEGYFITSNDSQNIFNFSLSPRRNDGTRLFINKYGYLKLNLTDISGNIISIPNFDIDLRNYYNSNINIKLKYDNTTQNLQCFVNGVLKYLNTADCSTTYLGDVLTIGILDNNYHAWNGSIDLKQFSVTVDGAEVFSGNKTGIDTIKPDNYTVVGSPTISADGVASGFSYSPTSNIATPNLSISAQQSLIIECAYFYKTSGMRGIYNFGSSTRFLGNSLWTGTSTMVLTFINELNSLGLSEGDLLKTKLILTADTATVYLYANGREITKSAPSTIRLNATTIYIGSSASNGYEPCGTSIDLNSFKIYVDGNLVYQPCLKIPYTESKTGSKIVNSIYRGRVNDMAEQFGSANYYTLDEDNGNFTLPMGELYGMIEKLNQLAKDEIGLPKATLSNTLNDNEIWLEGAEVSKLTYSKLYAIYGDDYGTPTDSANFVLPDFRYRVMQGIGSGGTFGYIEAGLPNIKGKQNEVRRDGDPNNNGALHSIHTRTGISSGTGGGQAADIYFDASWSNSIYGNSTTVQPPAIKVRFKTRFQ